MPKKVLIIDDEQDACLLLEQYLVKKNCEVRCAHTMAEGIDQLEALQPDLVLLDNRLPDGRGWAMAAKMQKVYPNMQIVLLSGFEMPPYPVALGLEFSKLEKPLDLAKIEPFLN